MSLYFDAVSVITDSSTGGSFKSRIYNSKNLKASPPQIYALIIEASKWDILLKEVIDNAGILKLEPKLYPLLATLLVHDHLLSKNGIAAPANHAIRQAVERHKTRLRAEFTKARVRRGCVSVEQLKNVVLQEKKKQLGAGAVETVYPRWVRINNVRTTMDAQLKSTFADYKQVDSLAELVQGDEKRMVIDPHIPDLVAVAPGVDFSTSPAYKNGEIILQDKASCFPAYLLVGDDDWEEGGLLDGCAAPGNKTTHLASLLAKQRKGKKRSLPPSIYSLDASKPRSKILQKMVHAAGADKIVTVLAGQDFLALDPTEDRFETVSGLLLDPSCSGSGIVGRDEVPKFTLPQAGTGKQPNLQGKKRKRTDDDDGGRNKNKNDQPQTASATDENEFTGAMSHERLTKLSNLQARIVEHALSFPAATRVTYSTCSIHLLENESVVSRILASDVAKRGGWRIMRRDEQPEGLKKWKHRGTRTEKDTSFDGALPEVKLTDEELDACLRCYQGDDEGLGGFFVAGFVRDESQAAEEVEPEGSDEEEDGDDDEWGGFSD